MTYCLCLNRHNEFWNIFFHFAVVGCGSRNHCDTSLHVVTYISPHVVRSGMKPREVDMEYDTRGRAETKSRTPAHMPLLLCKGQMGRRTVIFFFRAPASCVATKIMQTIHFHDKSQSLLFKAIVILKYYFSTVLLNAIINKSMHFGFHKLTLTKKSTQPHRTNKSTNYGQALSVVLKFEDHGQINSTCNCKLWFYTVTQGE